mmetsp:Transcript_19803/g.46141  ORF Transcript_19803/g.46141 Transcript_19803/m.46141 type:complete len:339 (-) Transcript_19803:817-1833(-)
MVVSQRRHLSDLVPPGLLQSQSRPGHGAIDGQARGLPVSLVPLGSGPEPATGRVGVGVCFGDFVGVVCLFVSSAAPPSVLSSGGVLARAHRLDEHGKLPPVHGAPGSPPSRRACLGNPPGTPGRIVATPPDRKRGRGRGRGRRRGIQRFRSHAFGRQNSRRRRRSHRRSVHASPQGLLAGAGFPPVPGGRPGHFRRGPRRRFVAAGRGLPGPAGGGDEFFQVGFRQPQTDRGDPGGLRGPGGSGPGLWDLQAVRPRISPQAGLLHQDPASRSLPRSPGGPWTARGRQRQRQRQRGRRSGVSEWNEMIGMERNGMEWNEMQFNSIQFNAMQFNAMQQSW